MYTVMQKNCVFTAAILSVLHAPWQLVMQGYVIGLTTLNTLAYFLMLKYCISLNIRPQVQNSVTLNSFRPANVLMVVRVPFIKYLSRP